MTGKHATSLKIFFKFIIITFSGVLNLFIFLSFCRKAYHFSMNTGNNTITETLKKDLSQHEVKANFSSSLGNLTVTFRNKEHTFFGEMKSRDNNIQYWKCKDVGKNEWNHSRIYVKDHHLYSAILLKNLQPINVVYNVRCAEGSGKLNTTITILAEFYFVWGVCWNCINFI